MSASATGGGLLKRKQGKAKRAFDTSLNITPMIDLMASTLCFLLLSATWVQTAKLDANLPSTASAAAPQESVEDPEEQFELQILLTKSRAIKIDRGDGLEDIEALDEGETFNWPAFDSLLKEVRQAHPTHEDATLSADPDVEYEHLIAAMDVAIANRISNVSLAASAVSSN